MPDWVVIADDLTGACDSGAAFAARGWTVQVNLSGRARELESQVWVITTESRALPGQDAEREVEVGLSSLLIPEESRIYKKIDSTLRGSPAEELRAVMRVLGLDRALITPAFPAQGRVVKDGRVWVNQVALEETPVSREVQEPNLASLFRRAAPVCEIPLDLVREGTDSIARLLDRQGPVLFTADAETDADLQHLAQAGMQAGLRLYCGSAGLAHALTAGRQVYAWASVKMNGPVLIAAGSRNPATQRQVAYARQQGTPVFTPSMDNLLSARGRSQSIQDIRGLLARGESVIISAEWIPFMPGKETEVAAWMASLAAACLEDIPLGGLALTGGDMAVAVCGALGCEWIDIQGEIQPGIVLGSLGGGKLPGLPVVTKSGGFGGEQTLVEIIRLFGF